MRHGKFILITGAVVAAGALAALPYQRAPVEDESFTANRSTDLLPLRSEESKTPELVTLSLSGEERLEALTDQSPAAGFLRQAKQQEEPKLEIPELRREGILLTDEESPELAPSFRPFTETIRLLRDAEADRLAQAQGEAGDMVPIAEERSVEEPISEKPLRRHRIVDGDTLPRLAERFYGDAKLGEAIYQANRGVLDHPDVLPLGAELVIPANPKARPQSPTILGVPRTEDGPLETITTIDNDGLVPIE